jgi:hypothetical protein
MVDGNTGRWLVEMRLALKVVELVLPQTWKKALLGSSNLDKSLLQYFF